MSHGKIYQVCLLGFFFLYSSQSFGQIFGPTNFDDCVQGMVKSARNPDYAVAQDVCRKKFPKLINLSLGRDAELGCEDASGKGIYHISFKSGKFRVRELNRVDFETLLQTKVSASFRGDSEQIGTGRKVKILGKIDFESGSGRLIVEYVDKRSADYTYEFSCTQLQ